MPAALLHPSLSNLETVSCENASCNDIYIFIVMNFDCVDLGYLKLMAAMNVMAGTRLVMAETNVADVITRLFRYRFCPIEPLKFRDLFMGYFVFELRDEGLEFEHRSLILTNGSIYLTKERNTTMMTILVFMGILLILFYFS